MIDSSKLEAAIKSNVEKSRNQKVSSVECPSGQEVDPGAKFSCTVDFANGKSATSTLEIRNKEADVDLVGFKMNE